MTAYYNEIDPFAAKWLRELIKAGAIAPGTVDERSIEDVRPADLRGFTQCHFFAGIGVWSYALRQSGWRDDHPVWSGSCPCQPFSAAGKGAGFADERHLWPAFFHLIEQCRPAIVFGEQVASKAVEPWIDLVQTDLEAVGYAFGCVPFPSASVGAPHIRDRAYWVADSSGARLSPRECKLVSGAQRDQKRGAVEQCGRSPGRMAYHKELGRVEQCKNLVGSRERSNSEELEQRSWGCGILNRDKSTRPTNGFWRDVDWLFCRDGKWRPVSSSPQPMVDGVAESLGRVCDESIKKIEEEIDAWSMEAEIDPSEALRDLWKSACSTAPSVWPAGGIPGLHETPFLLSFMRQLSKQGWRFKECTSVSRQEIPQGGMRMLRAEYGTTCPPYKHGLERRQRGEHPNPLCVLSSILARHAHTAWSDAHKAYAESCFPLVNGASQRVGRLRGYGNAINAEAAKAFITAFMEGKGDG